LTLRRRQAVARPTAILIKGQRRKQSGQSNSRQWKSSFHFSDCRSRVIHIGLITCVVTVQGENSLENFGEDDRPARHSLNQPQYTGVCRSCRDARPALPVSGKREGTDPEKDSVSRPLAV
jgi:hypothetical protein